MNNTEIVEAVKPHILYIIKSSEGGIPLISALSEIKRYIRLGMNIELTAEVRSDIAHTVINELFDAGSIFATETYNPTPELVGICEGAILYIGEKPPVGQKESLKLFVVQGTITHLYTETVSASIYAVSEDAAIKEFNDTHKGDWKILSILEIPQSPGESELTNLARASKLWV